MTEERLREIRRMHAAAHPDVWWELVRHDNSGGEINWQVWVHTRPNGFGFNTSDLDASGVKEAAEFVASAPTAVSELLAYVDALRERLAIAEKARDAERSMRLREKT